ncbi:MAG: Rid family hydrolase [Thermoguttaceae bacterium]
MLSHRITEQFGVRELFLTAIPSENIICQNDFQGNGKPVPDTVAQVSNLLREVGEVLQAEKFQNTATQVNVFLADVGKKQLVRKLLCDFFGENSPATTFVPQKPCDGGEIAVELYAIAPHENAKNTVSITRKSNHDKSICVSFDDLTWCFLADIVPSELPVGSYARSFDVFKKLESELAYYGLVPEQILRTWLYQGHLVLQEGDSQRYKELNSARTDFFSGKRFLADYLPKGYNGPTVYPASTGIGSDDVDIVIGGLALSTKRTDIIAVPLENPNQTSAFDYGVVYSPQSPKFARAMGLQIGDAARIYVSGTAGITESESRYENDPEAQTELTLDNIEALISGENLANHGIKGFDANLSDLAVARVYVKREAEYERIKAICEKRCKNIPILYTIADVCRPELLVEIEGIAVARKNKQ